MRNQLLADDRAVSEVLGFVLLFSVVLLSIVSMSIFGMNAVHEGRDTIITDNVQAGFEALALSAEDIYQERAPSRSVTITARRGVIRKGDPVTINVSVDGVWVANSTLEPIVFELEESRVIYSGTAVIREERGGAAMVHDPDFSLGGENLIIPVVRTNGTGSTMSVGGRTTITLVSVNATVNRTSPTSSLQIVIDAGSHMRAETWHRYLDETRSWDSCSVSGITVTCGVSGLSSRVLVHNVTIDYRFST